MLEKILSEIEKNKAQAQLYLAQAGGESADTTLTKMQTAGELEAVHGKQMDNMLKARTPFQVPTGQVQ